MNRIFFLFGIILISSVYTVCSQNYYCVNGYGKIFFLKNGTFYFDYFDVGNDTGTYVIKGDTILLNSSTQPVEFFTCNIEKLQDTSYLLDVRLRKYAKKGFRLENGKFNYYDGELLKDTIVKIDSEDKIYVRNMSLFEGSLITFDLFGGYRHVILKDTLFTGYFKIDVNLRKKVYFENYPLLIRDGYLLPFNEEANEYFKKINGFEFLPMKKGKKNQKYKTYLSGFGEIN